MRGNQSELAALYFKFEKSRWMRRLVGAAAIAGFATSGMASPIAWNAPQNISGPGTTTVATTPSSGSLTSGQTITNGTNDVSILGTQVFGINYSGPSGQSFPSDDTINGQLFQSVRDNVAGYSDNFANITTGFGTTGAAAQSYGAVTQPAFIGGATDYMLQNGKFEGGPNASITVSSLVQNDVYLVQFWVTDPRSFGVGRTETISAGSTDSNIPTLEYNQSTAGTDGQWVTGTFTADNTLSETFNFSASNDAQVNFFQLRDVTSVPEPTSLGLLGVGCLALVARRRVAPGC